jgi:ABC-type dipeptide/oligopeptide/nickel transport system permease component
LERWRHREDSFALALGGSPVGRSPVVAAIQSVGRREGKGVLLFLRVFTVSFFKRLPVSLMTLLAVATLVFSLMKAAGGELAFLGEGRMPSEEVLRTLKARYHLDKPMFEQYLINMRKVAVFDSLPSRVQEGKTFREIMWHHFPYSAGLGLRALTLAVVFGVPIGVVCAVWHNRAIDQAGSVMALGGVSVPNFILATMAVFFLAGLLKWFPATEWHQTFWRMWIPSACLAAFPFAAVLRLTRASMLESLREDYVRTARAKGVSEWKVIAHHAMRNSLGPVVTYVGPVTAGVLVGSLVVEKIFQIPGLGDMFVKSITNRDMPIILGATVFYSSLLVFMNLVVDSLYPVLNPRLRD